MNPVALYEHVPVRGGDIDPTALDRLLVLGVERRERSRAA
jgi:hypothetical protein